MISTSHTKKRQQKTLFFLLQRSKCPFVKATRTLGDRQRDLEIERDKIRGRERKKGRLEYPCKESPDLAGTMFTIRERPPTKERNKVY